MEKPEIPTETESLEKFYISFIRYLNQNEKGQSSWCVVYSTRMLLSRWGIEVSSTEVASALEMETRDTPYFSVLIPSSIS
jgi:hypothetical protein